MNKPKPIQYGLLFVMRVTLLHILISTATMVMAYAIDSDAQGVLDRKVTVHVDGAEVEHVLGLLSKQAKVKFTYNPQNIPLHKKVTLHVTDAKLSDVLTTVLNTNIDFKIVGKQIALKPAHDASASAAEEEHTTAQAEEPASAALEVSGKVVDAGGMGLPGVNVLVKGTSAGTSTDSDGLYKITVPTGEETLVFSFIGYTTQEVAIGGRSTIDVTLQEDILSLSEVVVVGYGTQEKKEVTAAISQVKGEDLLKSSAVSASNALAGRVPGLIVNQSNSEPGGDDATVFIRGKSTTGNNSALIVVDGIANRDGISRIDPNDIESITVLKDASAAIYGAQSGNGVILITTKRGKIGKPTINYSFNQGFVSPTRVVKMAGAGLFLRSVNADDIANGRTPTYTDQQIAQYERGELASTDWVKESFKNYSLQNRHSITLSGGNENVKYFVSGGTAFQDGIVKRDNTTEYRQYNIRSNIDAKVSERLSLGFDLAGRRENRNFLQVEQNNLFQAALLGLPTMPATINGLPTPGRLNYNPLAVAEGPGYNKLERNVLNGTLKAKYLIPGIEGLSADGFAAIDVVQDFQKQWTQPYTFYVQNTSGEVVPQKSPSSNQLRQDFLRSQSITLNAKLNYERVFGDHNIAAFVAYEQNEFRQDQFYTQRSDFETDQVDQLFAGSADGQMNDGSARETARQNYFGRVSYSLKDKYMAQVHFRYDGTNIFPADKRFGFFPGVSLGWRISEEAFLAGNAVVSNLKLRASWGKLGNDRIDPFQYLSLFGYGSGYVIDGQNVNTLNEGVSPNPNVTWEKKTTFNVGVEAGFLENKLTFELDVFSDQNRDILWPRNATVPNYTGLRLPAENIGEVDNKGFDGQVLYRNQIGDLSYSIGGNMTFARNKVVFLDEGATVPSYQKRAGKPVGDVSNLTNDLAYQVIGIYRTQSDLDTYPGFSGKRLGDLIYKDMNQDGLITGDDRVRLDQTNVPQMQYGINLGAQFKGFDFTMLFQGQARAQQYLTYNFSNISNGIGYYLQNAWSASNPNAELPAINRSKEINTLWVRDVSFLRLKNIELGYSIPRALTSKVGIQTLRLYVNGFNLLTFDKLKKDGLADPENINIQSWRYPHTKSINFGLNVTL